MQAPEPARARPGQWPPWLRRALPSLWGNGGPPEVGHKALRPHPEAVPQAGHLESLPVAGGSRAHRPSPERSPGPPSAQQPPRLALAWGWQQVQPCPGAEQSQEGRAAPTGLGHHQGCPWGLLGSEAADWLGSRSFPLRTAALYGVLYLEETGETPLYQPSAVVFTRRVSGQKEAFRDLGAPHTGLPSFSDAPTSHTGWSPPETPSEVLQQPGSSAHLRPGTVPSAHRHAHPLPSALSCQA